MFNKGFIISFLGFLVLFLSCEDKKSNYGSVAIQITMGSSSAENGSAARVVSNDDVTKITIMISGVDPVDVDVSPGTTVTETIDGVPLGEQTVQIDLKNSSGTVLYTQNQTVTVEAGETSTPTFPADDFQAENVEIALTSPNGGETWDLGTTHDITWTTSHPSEDVSIVLYKSGNAIQTISASTSGSGSYSWAIPSSYSAGTDYKIRVLLVSDPETYDESNANFSLAVVAQTSITVISPNGGEEWQIGSTQSITWTSNNLTGDVKIQLYEGLFFNSVVLNTNNDGSYSWTIPSSIDVGSNYKVRITSLSDNSIYDESDAVFTISSAPTTSSITVTSPNGGENWQIGSTNNITWSSNDVTGSVLIELLLSGNTVSVIASTNNSGSYSWTIPSSIDAGSNYKVKITSSSDNNIYDESDAVFTLSSAPTAISWQQAGLTSGAVYDIAINSQGHLFAFTSSDLMISTDNGDTWTSTGLEVSQTYNYSDAHQWIAITESDRIIVIVQPYSSPPSSIKYSDDNGNTWQESSFSTNFDFEYHYSISVAPNGYIFLGRRQDWGCTSCGIFRSTDNGASFSWIYQGPGEDDYIVRFVYKDDGTIFAGGPWYGEHMYKSTNNGSNWSVVNNGLQGGVSDLFVTPSGRILVDMANAYANGGGFFASDNDGSSWSPILYSVFSVYTNFNVEQFKAEMLSDNNGNIYAFEGFWDVGGSEANWPLGYVSADDGDTWDLLPDTGYIKDEDHSPVSSLITPSQYIFIGTQNGGIFKTVNPVASGN